ncbi:ACP S-malonyltransferase [Campylobacter sp. IFREMER_LSEM_CL2127]|uniref:ACP S-malonyltransferase n=1 Tax=Campylobacter sp. IFREMER_LSEM_CL2127 TaxID=2911619 RepID=UPI00127B848E|nr:ACP S-malonyltransferase [Campylobacter sp. IFREMER_LSEM_CL2127]EAI7262069.1 ACP S-malonyltransferase [Campylobacter lari]EAK0436618.1 ACP S-malonyltransferase [Campylobacter lari]EAK0804698.1 ACP S-malonyltransferase [Campylobacter lari]EAL9771667.1 [acyl-carrier-protein] S-malonyltransferase [Campylobacter lari]EGK7522706.1 ACP S-malonyltransferase [Campylobacter lari]
MNSAFIFPGQGSQSVGMGLSFYDNSKKAKELLDNASDFCKIDFKNLLFKENENLNKSEFTQMAIVLNSLMAYEALKEQVDIEAKYSLGHSLGEFSALATQDAFSFLDVIALVNKRGKFMQEDCSKIEAGMMVILGLEDKVVEELCQKALSEKKNIFAANYNCDGQIVVAGLKPDLASYESEFKNAGAKRAMLLNMSVASHCPLLKNASLKLTKELEPILKESFKSVVSNVNAKVYNDKNQALMLLSEQLIKPVLYKQSIKVIDEEVDFYIEFGASVLKGLNKKITQKETYTLSKIEDIDEILKVIK